MQVSRRSAIALGGAAVAGGAVAFGVFGSPSSDDGPVQALVAGSLEGVASDVPGGSVEAHGSVATRRLVVDGLRDPDAVALADPGLFDGIADTVTVFATNALVVTYDPDSPHADAIREDWATALARDDVRVGRTDPEQDPLGYRTVMALRLAERLGIADADLVDRTRIYPETALTQQVAVGKIDAAFTYRSMAVERDLEFVSLPERIDFSDPAHADTYRSVSLELDDRTVHGGPIRYGAVATTSDGEEWLGSLVTGTERLRDHGFVVPTEYPRTSSV